MFLFKDELLQKHDDVSMRSPITLTMANFFLSSLQNKLLKTRSEFHPKLYLRYVFSVFNNDKKCFKFFVMFSINIKFTMKHLLETISFLDFFFFFFSFRPFPSVRGGHSVSSFFKPFCLQHPSPFHQLPSYLLLLHLKIFSLVSLFSSFP